MIVMMMMLMLMIVMIIVMMILIDLTLVGIVIDVNDEQDLNAYKPNYGAGVRL